MLCIWFIMQNWALAILRAILYKKNRETKWCQLVPAVYVAELWPSLLLTMQVKWPQKGVLVTIRVVPSLETVPTVLLMATCS